MVDDQDLGRLGVRDAPELGLQWLPAAAALDRTPVPTADCPCTFAQTRCPIPVLLQNILGLAVAALFIAYNYFTAEVPRAQE
ncbi:hypothetical protein ABPG77_002867 [Micractinium sp. CCAP 211/92]